MFTSLDDAAANDLLGCLWSVAAACWNAFDGSHDVHALDDLTEYGVSGWRPRVPPVQEIVVLCVDEKLRTSTVGTPGVGHGQGADFVGKLSVFRVLIRNVPSAVSHNGLAIAGGVFATAFWPSCACLWSIWVGRIRTATLKHEALDHSVEMQAVVVALLHQIKEITGRDRHGVGEEFDGNVAGSRFHEDLHEPTTERHLKRICLSSSEAHVHNRP